MPKQNNVLIVLYNIGDQPIFGSAAPKVHHPQTNGVFGNLVAAMDGTLETEATSVDTSPSIILQYTILFCVLNSYFVIQSNTQLYF